MEVADLFSALAHLDLLFVAFAREFYRIYTNTELDDTTLNSLFWIGANYHRPVDLPDTTGLSWRKGILQCLEIVLPRSRTSPPSSPSAIPQSSLSAVAHPSPPPFVAQSSLLFMENASPPPSFAPSSLPPSAAKSRPPFVANASPPTSAALSSLPFMGKSMPPSVAPSSMPPSVATASTPPSTPLRCQACWLQPQTSWIQRYPWSSQHPSSLQCQHLQSSLKCPCLQSAHQSPLLLSAPQTS